MDMLFRFVELSALAGVAAFLLIVVLTPFADRLRLLDRPNLRKSHQAPVPMVGGIAIYLVLLASFVLMDPPLKAGWFLFALTLLVATGLLDDVFGLGVKTRIAAQCLASVVMIFGAGLSIQSLGLGIPNDGALGLVGIGLTLFAVVGLTNGFNMVDGIDGLAAGHLMIGLLCLVGIQVWAVNTVHQAEWLSLLFSAVFAFWLVNMSLTPLKRVFLGDSGSLLLGFTMSWLLIYYSQAPIGVVEPVAALWCVTLPVFDTLVVIARRLKNGRSPFSPDRNHLHHLLVDQGASPRVALALILVISLGVNVVGICVTHNFGAWVGLAFYCGLLVGFTYMMLHPRVELRLLQWVRLAGGK
jgi:undecaprenyl-phosphate alpha-N-acetylglucosaminyl 1-phosphatetransferase